MCVCACVCECVCVWVWECAWVCVLSAPGGPLSGWVSLVAVITLLTTLHSKPYLAWLFRFLFPGSCLPTIFSSSLSPPLSSFPHPSLRSSSCLTLLPLFFPPLLQPSPFSHSIPFVVMAADWWSLFSFNYTAGERPSLFTPLKQKTRLG